MTIASILWPVLEVVVVSKVVFMRFNYQIDNYAGLGIFLYLLGTFDFG